MMTGHENAGREAVRYLVRINQTPGFAAHIPDAAGHSLCKSGLKGSLWQLEERHVQPTVICYNCRVLRAWQARS